MGTARLAGAVSIMSGEKSYTWIKKQSQLHTKVKSQRGGIHKANTDVEGGVTVFILHNWEP